MSKETIEFMRWAIHRLGLGESTYVPEAFLKDPPNLSMEEARRESEMVIFGAVDELLVKTKVKCDDIGILVVNCSLFHVTPSLSSVIINKYKFRNNIVNYNLSGMGCSAGLLAIGLAKQLLQVHHNSYALVVSTETLAPYIYMGNDGSKSLANCIFRVGGAAILLSNQPSDSRSSKYELIHAVHSYTASSDSSYNCIIQEEDEEGRGGITITKDLSIAAVDAIKSNLISLEPLVLPFSERARYLLHYIMRRLHVANIKPYVPNFKRTFDHFLPHVGTKPLLDGLQKNLGLSEDDMEPSRMTLDRFGNTSSSSVWYELAYAEAKRKIKKGDRVWQIAFGSGFKCTSLIWHAMRAVDREEMNPWSDEIDGFPVDLTNIPSATYFKSSI
ncbi:very-long-chain 3-oxoacyl-CoA synthase [Sarracenia purpurea var. burkii]